jgi:hypothetical protein
MRKILFAFMAIVSLSLTSCEKETESFEDISTPRSSVPDELVGRWAIVGISGSTVYNIPAGTTYNTNEYFLGYQINKDGTVKEDGYLATYNYGVSTWTKWTAYGSVALNNGSIEFHRAHGSYTSSRSSSAKAFGSAEVYPNKSSFFDAYEIGTNSRGELALFLQHDDGSVSTYVKQ